MLNKLLDKNSVVWLIAILMASLIWLAAFVDEQPKPYAQDITRTFVNIPIMAINIPNDVFIENMQEGWVVGYLDSVTVLGPAAVVNSTTDRNLRAFVDLNGLVEGTHTAVTWVNLPANLQETNHEPMSIAVRIESTVSKDMIVEIGHNSALPENVYFMGGRTTPTQVRITGPKTRVEASMRAVAVTSPLEGLNNQEHEVSIKLYDAENNIIEDERMVIEPATVQVSQTVEQSASVHVELLPDMDLPESLLFKNAWITPSEVNIIGDPLSVDSYQNILLDLKLDSVEASTLSQWGLTDADLFWQALLGTDQLEITQGTIFSQVLNVPYAIPLGLRSVENRSSSSWIFDVRLELEWIGEDHHRNLSVDEQVYENVYQQVGDSVYLPLEKNDDVDDNVYGLVYINSDVTEVTYGVYDP